MTATLLSERVDCPCGNPVHLPQHFKEPVPCIGCGKPHTATARAAPAGVNRPAPGPAASPARGPAGAGTPRKPIAPRDPSAPKIETTPAAVPAQSLRLSIPRSRGYTLPNRCACCMGPSSTAITITGERTQGNVRHRLTMSIPTCSTCEGHRGTLTTRRILAGFCGLIALCFLLPFITVMYSSRRGKQELDYIALAIAGAPSFYFGFGFAHLIIPVLGLGREHGSEGEPASIRSFDDESIELQFENPAYGALFAAQNNVRSSEAIDRTQWLGFFYGYREDADGSPFRRRYRALASTIVASLLWLLIASGKVIK